MGDKLPIIEITGDNFHLVWPSLSRAISDASFIAIDCELSGLGNRSKINSPQLDVRYHNLVEVAQSYGVVALGISCFSCLNITNINLQRGKDERLCTHDYIVQTYNVLTMCSDPFTVECDSLKFLHKHGFDFNKLYAKGVLYYKGCDRKNDKADKSPSVRHIFNKILEHRKPLVVHNGLIDLVFLYQSFYCDLPKTNDTFAADLEDLFPQGIYDTKYLAEFHQAVPATYLEYLFKKMQLRNLCNQKNGRWHARVRFPPYPKHTPSIDWHPYLQIHSYRLDQDEDKRELCQVFAFHGNCKNEGCTLSHNVNRVVKVLQAPGAKKRGDSKYSGPKKTSLVDTIAKLNRSKEEEEEEDGNTGNRRRRRPGKRKAVNGNMKEEDFQEEGFKRRKESEEEGRNGLSFRDAKVENMSEMSNIDEVNGLSSIDTKDVKVSESNSNVRKNGLSSRDTKNDTKDEDASHRDGNTRKNGLSSSDTKDGNASHLNNVKNGLSSDDSKNDTKDKNASQLNNVKNGLSSSNTKNENASHSDGNTKKNGLSSSDTKDEDERTRSTSGHRAGYDAFMTGFIFAGIVSDKGVWTSKETAFTAHNIGLSQEVNKMYLMGKNIPFLIRKSAYASKSLKHCSKIEKVRCT